MKKTKMENILPQEKTTGSYMLKNSDTQSTSEIHIGIHINLINY